MENNLTDEEYAEIILQQGPFTQAEIQTWSNLELDRYFDVMKHNIQKKGIAEFEASKDTLREMTQIHILQEPELLHLGASEALSRKVMPPSTK